MIIKRNLLVYFRDRSAVFFSLLASIISLCLYLFFINASIISSMSELFDDMETIKVFLNALLICGVIGLNSFTIPLSFFNMFVQDKEKKVIKDFFVSPVKKTKVIFSYIVCSVIATILINAILFLVLIGYLSYNNLFRISIFDGVIVVLGYLFANCLFSLIAFFVANFVKTSSAYGNLIGLSSALVGFLSGVYMPIGNFSNQVIENIITIFPVTQLIALLKSVFLNDVTEKLFHGAPENIISEYELYYGIRLELFGNDVTLMTSGLYFLILFTTFTLLSIKFIKST